VPLNPFHFGFEVDDRTPPEINALRIYYLDADHNVFHAEDYSPAEIETGRYTMPESVLAGAWRVAFAVKVDDRMDGVPNKHGLYTLDLAVDGTSQFAFKMDEVSFSESRYINAHTDYGAAADNLGMMHRCFKLPGNELDFYQIGPDNGYVQLFEQQPRKVSISVSDFDGNTSTLDFDIFRDGNMFTPDIPNGAYCDNKSSLWIRKDAVRFDIPSGAVYCPTYFNYETTSADTDAWYGPIHTLGSKHIPLHRYSELSVRAESVPAEIRSKAFIARLPDDKDDEIVSYGGTMVGDWITTATRACGSYGVRVDTLEPVITPLEFSEDMTGKTRMTFKITDNVETSGRASSLEYDTLVDGKWILMEYDAKNDLLTHWFDERITSGSHTLRITVRDDRNNIATFERQFIR
jgi:hypothetical protein